MKKLLSAVLSLVMLFSMITTASAVSIGDLIDTPEDQNFLEYNLPIYVSARKDGENDFKSAQSGLELLDKDLRTEGVLVDYKAELDMTQIRDVFYSPFFETLKGLDDNEFENGKVNTNVTVTIEYDKGTVINTSAGSLTGKAAEVYEETGRSVTSLSAEREKIEITFREKLNNGNRITVAELEANNDDYFSDIVFELPDAVNYTDDGNYTIQVTLSGKTTFEFATKTVNIGYGNEEGSGKYVVSAATEHKLVVVPVEPATCTKKGSTEGVMCETHNSYSCGANGLVMPQQSIDKLSHNLVFIALVDSTCTSTGVKAHYTCQYCKVDFTDASANTVMNKADLVIGKKAHNFEVIAQVDPTCTENGMTAGGVCKVCGHTKEREILTALGHSESLIAAINPDCEHSGWTAGKECSRCHTILVAPKPVPAIGHNFGEWNVTQQPTEEETGSKTRTCLNGCGTTETVEIPKLEHTCAIKSEAAVITKAATCTETGLKQNYCACGEPVGNPEVIAAIGHAPTKISEYIAATCTKEGVLEHWGCTNCGGLFTDSACNKKITSAKIAIDVNNHGSNKAVISAIAPTCEKDGLTQGEKCIACKKITIPQTEVPKTGHTFERIPQRPATCTEEGMHAHDHCKVCDKDYTSDRLTEITAADYILPALGHSFNFVDMETLVPATEDAEGLGRIYCSRCTHSKDVPIAKLEHIHNETCEKIITPATCTTNGLKRIVYTCCNEIKEDNIVIYASHTPRKVEKIPSTCYHEGVEEHWYCSVCDELFADAGCTQKTTIEELTLDVETHDFVFHHDNNNFTFYKCSKCNDMQKVAKSTKANVVENGNDKEKQDKVKEERINEDAEETGRKVYVYPDTDIKDDVVISATLEQEIHKNDTETNKASEEKVVVEITVEKVTIYVANDNNKPLEDIVDADIIDEEREIVNETKSLKQIEISIPSEMQSYADFLVHRIHNGEAQTLTTNPNSDGEYIVIAPDKSKVTIFVKKFSEYALVGYATKVNPSPITPSTGGGSSNSYTITLNANGGTLLNNVIVKRGEKVVLPTPTRSGYIFAGWYLDSKFTTPFDADTVINRGYTLYAKWVEIGECSGTVTDNCPCLKYTDLDPSLWYHVGVDYVLNRGMMIGVSSNKFAPNTNVTRAMLVTVLWRAEGKPIAGETTFTDLEDGQYYVDAVEWASANGVVNGYSDTKFAPDAAITREQFAAIMYRYAKTKGYDVSVGENTNILSYTDYNNISEYAIEAMQYTLGSGLIKGRTESTLNPKDNTTRAEMATILYRFFTAN